MRGKVAHRAKHHAAERITPAYAGKRHRAFDRSDRVEDHPRLCGEKGGTFKSVINGAGSPPPMRGKD